MCTRLLLLGLRRERSEYCREVPPPTIEKPSTRQQIFGFDLVRFLCTISGLGYLKLCHAAVHLTLSLSRAPPPPRWENFGVDLDTFLFRMSRKAIV